jgi:hypothetical protein
MFFLPAKAFLVRGGQPRLYPSLILGLAQQAQSYLPTLMRHLCPAQALALLQN